MAKEVETRDGALFTHAIHNATLHLGTDNWFLCKFYISSGMILS